MSEIEALTRVHAIGEEIDRAVRFPSRYRGALEKAGGALVAIGEVLMRMQDHAEELSPLVLSTFATVVRKWECATGVGVMPSDDGGEAA